MERNHYLFKEGEKCDKSYIVISGEFEVTMKGTRALDANTVAFSNDAIRPPVDRIQNEHQREAVRERYLQVREVFHKKFP